MQRLETTPASVILSTQDGSVRGKIFTDNFWEFLSRDALWDSVHLPNSYIIKYHCTRGFGDNLISGFVSYRDSSK